MKGTTLQKKKLRLAIKASSTCTESNMDKVVDAKTKTTNKQGCLIYRNMD